MSGSPVTIQSGSSSPVLMVFLKAPRTEAVKTRLAAELGQDRATDIYRGMVERQLRQIPFGWRIEIHFSPPEAQSEMQEWLGNTYAYKAQRSGDLGQRLAGAFEDAFAAGERAVMAVGGDCPELDTTTFIEASNRLTRADIVIGPAEDGGYYLIALRRFAPELFKDIPWSTPHVLSLTLARAKICSFSRELLAPKADIDDLAGYESYLRRVVNEPSGDSVAVIVPTLNEEKSLAKALASARQSFPGSPLIVVDGGSEDRTVEIASEHGARVIVTSPSRGAQCRVGAAAAAKADWLLFLHADCVLPTNTHSVVTAFLAEPRSQIATFRLRFDSGNWLLRVCGWFTRIDSVFTRFGDQGIFIRRDFYEALGGFPNLPLFEDVALLQRARAVIRIQSLRGYITTSARRFQARGVLRQQWLNARLLIRYLRGTSPTELAALYAAKPKLESAVSTTGVSASVHPVQ